MTLNPKYKQKYTEALKKAAEATRELNDYIASLERGGDDHVHYLSQEEGHLLEKERTAIDRYHIASKNYFGKE